MANKQSTKDRKKHKKEKSKKHKKEKKSKKYKKQKQKYESDDSSASESETSLKGVKQESPEGPNWNFLDTVLSDSNISIKNKKQKVEKPSPERLGQNIRELNPYWRDGGCGLPPNAKEKVKSVESTSVTFSQSTSSIKPNFLKPGEHSNYNINKNTFQRNWKKKELENKTIEPKVNNKGEIESNSTNLFSNEDLNKLASKLVKAEIMGNTSLINKLKAELEAAKKAKGQNLNDTTEEKSQEVVILTDRLLKKPYEGKQNYSSSKKQKVNTHDATGRVCYFPDDDKYSLQNLFQKEKEAPEEEILFPTKLNLKNRDELDDIYLDAAASNKMQQKIEDRKSKRTVKEAIVKHKSLEGCHWCLDNRNDTKHLIVSTGDKCYLCLPKEESLTKGHCIIVPLQHEISALHLDEDVWNEIKTYQKVLAKMFLEQNQDVVFFENARSFKHFPHCIIQCVPLDKEMGDVAPIYFQKAISESETEWSNNKKVVDFRKKDLRRSIPKGLPYFAVSFGTEGGFAHIIEDERLFKKNFAEEVLGGMLDLDPRKWRKPHKEMFRAQREKALEFLKMWKKFEFNENSYYSDSSNSE